MNNISIKKIAEMAGVSTATVSRVLNDTGRFSEETRMKVLKLVEEYGYRTNIVAKSLRTNRSQTLGVIIPDITNEFFAQIVLAIENYCFPKGYSIFVCNTNENGEKEKQYLKSLEAKGVDGLIYLSGVAEFDEGVLGKIPRVCIDRKTTGGNSVFIASDNYRGGFLATEELITKKCRRIVILKDYRNTLTSPYARYEGYRDALKQYNLPFEQELVLNVEIGAKEARTAITNLLRAGISFDGIFAVTDNLAAGAIAALKDHHIKIPEQVKIVGFDNISISQYSTPSISTVNQNTEQMGEIAARILLDIIENKKTDHSDVTLPVELIVRESSGL